VVLLGSAPLLVGAVLFERGPIVPVSREPMMEWYLKVLRQYVDFAGRARRKEYWMFTLVSVIISLVLAILDNVLTIGVLGLLYSLAVLLPSLAVGVRRLHDTGRSGWWLLISLIPLIGAIVLVVFFATDGEPQPNAYGPDPKAVPGEFPVFS
jgi:uncharacterized membrane protein YhaH (DUF805 family)